MTFGPDQDLVLLALLVAIAALLVLAPYLRVPYPILLVLGGLALGFAPGIPTISLPPDVVLVAVLPPLLYSAAFYTSLGEEKPPTAPLRLFVTCEALTGLILITWTASRWILATGGSMCAHRIRNPCCV